MKLRGHREAKQLAQTREQIRGKGKNQTQNLALEPVHPTSACIASSLCHGSQLPHLAPEGHEDLFLVFSIPASAYQGPFAFFLYGFK